MNWLIFILWTVNIIIIVVNVSVLKSVHDEVERLSNFSERVDSRLFDVKKELEKLKE